MDTSGGLFFRVVPQYCTVFTTGSYYALCVFLLLFFQTILKLLFFVYGLRGLFELELICFGIAVHKPLESVPLELTLHDVAHSKRLGHVLNRGHLPVALVALYVNLTLIVAHVHSSN